MIISKNVNALQYIASYSDLISAFGVNADLGVAHYNAFGLREGRELTFSGLAYIASYADLINAFGANAESGAAHFITYGLREARTVTFDGLAYIASYSDLVAAFGADSDAGATHFITFGLREGRAVRAATVQNANAVATQTTTVLSVDIAEHDMATLAGLAETVNRYNITVTDSTVNAAALLALDAKTIGLITLSGVTSLTGSAADINAVLSAPSNQITGRSGSLSLVLSGSVLASDIKALDTATTTKINATAVTLVVGTYADVNDVLGSTGPNGIQWGSPAVTLTGTVSAANANTMAGLISGVLTATLEAATLSSINTTLTSVDTSDRLTIIVNNTSLSNDDLVTLNALDARVGGTIDASLVTSVSGTYSNVNTAYTSLGITGLGSEAVTLSGTISATNANTVAGLTSGVLTATITSGFASDINTALANAVPEDMLSITLTDESVLASDLVGLNGKTGVIINATSVIGIVGSYYNVDLVYKSSGTGFSGLGNEAVLLNDVGDVDVDQVNTVQAYTSGTVTAIINQHSMLDLIELDQDDAPLANAYEISVTDATVDAGDLNVLDTKTSVVLDASEVNELIGEASEVAAAFVSAYEIDPATLTLATDVAVTLAGIVNAADLRIIDRHTSATVNALDVTEITGSAADIAAVISAPHLNGIDTDLNVAVTIDAGVASASDLNLIDMNTNAIVDASAVTAVTGTYKAILLALNAAGLGGLDDVDAEVDGVISVAQANNLSALTTGAVTATITDTASNLARLTSGEVNTYSLTVTDAVVSAADLLALDLLTTLDVNATAATKITGSATDILAALNSPGIDTTANIDLIVTGALTVDQANALDALTAVW